MNHVKCWVLRYEKKLSGEENRISLKWQSMLRLRSSLGFFCPPLGIILYVDAILIHVFEIGAESFFPSYEIDSYGIIERKKLGKRYKLR